MENLIPRGRRRVVIAGCANDKFAMPMAITFRSVLEHLRADYDATFFVIDGGISGSSVERLRRVIGRFNSPRRRANLEIRPINPNELNDLTLPGRHKSVTTYYRLLLPSVVPEQYDKVIYLDSDLLVRADLANLWEADMLGKPLLAARDFGIPSVSSRTACLPYQEIGLDPEAAYLNAGVMVIDLARWKQGKFSEIAMRYTREHSERITYADQDGINVALHGNWGEIDQRWNVPSYILEEPIINKMGLNGIDRSRRQTLIREAFVIHSLGPRKPWSRGYALPGQFDWLKTLLRSGWYEFGEIEPMRRLCILVTDWVMRKVYRSFHRLGRHRPSNAIPTPSEISDK